MQVVRCNSEAQNAFFMKWPPSAQSFHEFRNSPRQVRDYVTCDSRATLSTGAAARRLFVTLLAVAPTLARLALQLHSRSACTAWLARPWRHWCVIRLPYRASPSRHTTPHRMRACMTACATPLSTACVPV